ncbi:MAG: hypothetical protein JEY94_00570 [Melioribacteraceae bacterium]|nr:hypothetical protein [Melioribacteraceae bacterium]
MAKSHYKLQDTLYQPKQSKLQKYKDLIVGSDKLSFLIKYELINLFVSWLPGALGIVLRNKLYPAILAECGRGVNFGRNIVIRHPQKIKIGNDVNIDDNVLLDAKGDKNAGIILKDQVFIGRNSILSCKDGDITLEQNANIGFNCEIASTSKVVIGKDNLIAAYTYIMGGGNYKLDNLDLPFNQQYDYEGKGGVILHENVWLGAHVSILDGVTIESGSVVATGAVVNKSIPKNCIAGGIPAKVFKNRGK